MSKLKEIREYQGISQGKLAYLSKVKLRTIKAYEQGYRDINKASYKILHKLADALKCEITDLLEDENEAR